jgi:hypothetical protein
MLNGRDFDIIHHIQPGKHFYQFYKNQDYLLRVLIPYFEAGLQKGEACLWLVSKKTGVSETTAFAETRIPRFLYYLASGQIQILPAEDWYLTDGLFDEEKAMSRANETVAHVLKMGYHRLRGAGDMGSIPRRDWGRVHIYEGNISGLIRSASLIALCAYPISQCTLPDTKSILENHNSVLVGRR